MEDQRVRDFVKKCKLRIRILFYLKVLRIRYKDRGNTKLYPLREEWVNMYNPLSYLLLFSLLPISVFLGICNGVNEWFKLIKDSLKHRIIG